MKGVNLQLRSAASRCQLTIGGCQCIYFVEQGAGQVKSIEGGEGRTQANHQVAGSGKDRGFELDNAPTSGYDVVVETPPCLRGVPDADVAAA